MYLKDRLKSFKSYNSTLCAAYVCADRGVPAFGSKGCSLHIQEISRTLSQQQIPVSLFVASIGGSCPDTLTPNSVHRIKHAHLDDRAAREHSDIQDNLNTIKKLRKSGPFDLVYERYSLWSYAGMAYARKQGVPAVLEVNAPLIEEQQRYRSLIDKDAAEAISRRCFADATLILAVSRQIADYLSQFSETKGKVHLLPNGVNTEHFSTVINQRRHQKRPFTLGFVGTLKPWHGVENLVACFAQLHQCYTGIKLLIVGDGPQRQSLQKQIIELGIEHAVNMTGAVPPEHMPDYYAMMDVGVAPYPDNIPFYFSPLKIFEYMAAGLPVVASDIGQISEVVAHQKTGLLYRAGDQTQLFTALEALILTPVEALRLGEQGRQTAVNQHSWQQRVDEILQLTGLRQGASPYGSA